MWDEVGAWNKDCWRRWGGKIACERRRVGQGIENARERLPYLHLVPTSALN